jgi:hypothetical protein
MPMTKIAGSSQAMIRVSTPLGGVAGPKRLLPGVPGIKQKSKLSKGTSTRIDSHPVVLKSWQRWMVSMKTRMK